MPDGVDGTRRVGATERQQKEEAGVILLVALPDSEVDVNERCPQVPVKVRADNSGVLVKVHSGPKGFCELSAKEENMLTAQVVYTVVGGSKGYE